MHSAAPLVSDDQISVETIKAGGKTNLLILFEIRKNCHRNGKIYYFMYL